MAKRLFAMVLVLALLVSLMPNMAVGVSAEGLDKHTDHTGWNVWTDTTKLPDVAGQYCLDVDVNLSATWETGGEIHLCLNGHTIKQTGANARVIKLKENAKLSVYDCGAAQGKITGGKQNYGSAIYVDRGGVLNLYGGIITGNALAGNDYDGAIYLRAGHKDGNKAGGVLNMYGGTISGNGTAAKTYGGAVYAHGETTAANRSDKPAAFNMYGGTISGNKARFGAIAGAGDALINVQGGTITGNEASGGAAIRSTGDMKVNIGKVKITGNTASYVAGAVYAEGNVVVTIKDTTITGNTATTAGAGGVGSAVYLAGKAKLVLSGAPTIANNTNGFGVDIRANGNETKLYTSELTGGYVVYSNKGVTDATAAADAFAIAAGGTQAAAFRGTIELKVGTASKRVAFEEGAFKYIDGHFHGGVEYTAWTDAKKLPSSGTYYLANDVTVVAADKHANVKDGNTLRLCVNGRTVTQAIPKADTLNYSELFRVSDGKLYLEDCTTVYDDDGYFVSGGKLTGGVKKGEGAAVYINHADAIFEAKGIEFSNNTDTLTGTQHKGGGAIFATKNKTMAKLVGCKFSGNTSGENGGALAASAGGILYAEKTIFENNKAKRGALAGLDASTLAMFQCKVTGSTASVASAIYATGASTVTLNDTSITGGKAAYGFGALNLASKDAKITLKGKTVIYDNKGQFDEQQNLHLQNVEAGVNVSGLTEDAKVGVSLHKDRITAGKMYFSTDMTANPGYCISDDAEYGVELKDGKLILSKEAAIPPEPEIKHIHKLCNEDACTAHGDAVEFQKWEQTDSLPKNGNWYLSDNVTVTAETVVNGELNLCLNGKTITQTGSARVYNIGESKKVSITDCGVDTVGTITGGKNNTGSAIYVNNKAVLSLYAGRITGNGPVATTAATGAAIFLRSGAAGATFNMYGGEITGNGGSASWGGAVSNGSGNASNTVYVNIYGGKIYGNTAGTGGAIRLQNKAVLTVYGGEISGNTAADKGGAVYLEGAATIDLQGGTITGNAANEGAGIYAFQAATVKVSGAPAVKDNLANSKQNNLFLAGSGKITLGAVDKDARIGVSVAKAMRAISTQTGTDYTANFVCDNSKQIMLYQNKALFVGVESNHPKHCVCDGAASGCDHSGKTWLPWESTSTLPTESGYYYLTGPVQLSDYQDTQQNQDIYLCLNGQTVTAAKDKRHLRIFKGTTYNITDCSTAPGGFTGGKSTYGGAINVRTGSALNLFAGRIFGNQAVDTEGKYNEGGAIYLAVGAKLNMYGGEITQNTAGRGAGIRARGLDNTVATPSQVNIYGGKISGNTAKELGGGVYVDTQTVLELRGGTITNNTAKDNGAGIYVNSAAKLNIYPNVQIADNQAGRLGGGLFATGADTLVTMNGGTISGNTALAGGGAITQSHSRMVMNGGTITGNAETKAGGAGVYVSINTVFEMNGGEITGNYAETNGAGIFAQRGTVILNKGTVANNTSVKNGGGMYIKGSQLVTKSVTIRNNKAANGGGIYASYEPVKQTDGTTKDYTSAVTIGEGTVITANSATANGGGLGASRTEITMLGGQISKNYAKASAGGILMQSKTKLTMKGGKIASNTAEKGGGAIYVSTDTEFYMQGGTISGNSAVEGGAIYFLRSKGVLSGGSISANHAKCVVTVKDGTETKTRGEGGGISVRGSTVSLNGTSLTGNAADRNAGAIYAASMKINGINYATRVTMNGGVISGNKALNAGGILTQSTDTTLNLYGGLITKNEASMAGGAMYISSNSVMTMTGTRVVENYAEKQGGGIYCLNSTVSITGNELHSNKSGTSGGNLVASGSKCKVTVEDMKLYGGEANAGGFMIAQSSGTLNVINCEMYGNKARTSNGGAVFISTKSFGNFTNCKFFENESAQFGGAVLVTNFGNGTFKDCQFYDNHAGSQAGALSAYLASETKFTNCTFTKNTAETEGGAILCKGNMDLVDCLIEDNTAGTSGGGIMSDLSSCGGSGIMDGLLLKNTVIRNNTAKAGVGGGIHGNSGNPVTIYDSQITGNTSGLEGGGIWAFEDLKLYDTTITGNVSGGEGYALYYSQANYDDQSYFTSRNSIGGDVIVQDNEGGDAYLAKDVVVVIDRNGLGDKAHIELTLDSGVVTNRIFGAYHYEGGDRVYTITAGDRSITDPEYDASLNERDAQAAADMNVIVYCGVGVAVAAIAAVVVLLVLKKKKAGKTAAEANKE